MYYEHEERKELLSSGGFWARGACLSPRRIDILLGEDGEEQNCGPRCERGRCLGDQKHAQGPFLAESEGISG